MSGPYCKLAACWLFPHIHDDAKEEIRWPAHVPPEDAFGPVETHTATKAPALPCPEPGDCAAGGKCGEDASTTASVAETSERCGQCFHVTHTRLCPECACAATLSTFVAPFPAPATTGELTAPRTNEAKKEYSRGYNAASKREASRIIAMDAEIAALRASLAESEKEIETLKIGEDSKVERLRAQMRSDHELCAIEHDREKARADAAIAERDALRQIVEEAPCLCLTKYLPKHSPHCWKAKARAKENA
jgi:hypothetical protein